MMRACAKPEHGETLGKLLHLPITTAAGDVAALRAELVERLRERRTAVIEEMVDAVQRAGLATVLQVGNVALAHRLDQAVGIMLDAWEHRRPLRGAELEEIAELGAAVARSGVPVWRLLSTVQQATRAAWQYVLEHALALGERGRRPGTASQLIGDLSVELFEVVGRIEAQLAAGYADTRLVGAASSPTDKPSSRTPHSA